MNHKPRCVVFDLDDCLWYPEMYQLWGGGSPFRKHKDGILRDKSGTKLYLHEGVRDVLKELHSHTDWEDTILAIASCCDEPEWANEALDLFEVNETSLNEVFQCKEIYKGNKQSHLRNISKQTGIPFEEMVFFDDQMGNCKSVAQLGCTVYHVPNGGAGHKAWQMMQQTFPSPGKVITVR